MSTEIEEELRRERRRAVESLEEAVYSRSRLNVGKAPRLLAQALFIRLKDAVGKGSDIGEWWSKGSAAKELGTTVTSTSFKAAVKKLPKALRTCRPESQSLPRDEDCIGVAAIDASIGGVPHLVIVRGPTAEYRPGAPNNDDSLRLKVEFRPSAIGEPVLESKGVKAPFATRTRVFVAAVALTAIAVLAIFVWPKTPPASPPRRISAPARPSVDRHAIAVMTFHNGTGEAELEWLSTALPEILSQAMTSPRTRVIPREEVVRMEEGLRLHGTEATSAGNLARVRKRVHANSVIVGAFSRVGGPGAALLQVQVNLLDAHTGAALATDSAIGNETQLVEIVMRAGATIRERLKIGAVQEDEIKASVPSVHKAHQLYADGLAHLRRFRAKEARDLLLQAAVLDETHPLINFALSAACDTLGRESEARAAIKKARAHWEGLSGEQKARIEVQYHKHEARSYDISKEREAAWQNAISAQRKLCNLEENRDDIECDLQLAELMVAASKTNDALDTIKTFREHLSRPLATDGRLDLVEARAHQERSESKQHLALAISAANKGKALDDCALFGQARLLQATALLEIPDIPASNSAIDDARDCFHKIGDIGGDARAIEQKATSVGINEDLELERQLLRQAFDAHRRLGDVGSMARVTVRMSIRLVREGKAREAQKSLDDALDVFKRVGGPYEVAATLHEIGTTRFDRGDLGSAEKYYRQALSMFQAIPNSRAIAYALTNLGEVLACRGDLSDARKLHLDSFNINSGVAGGQANNSGVAYDLFMIGQIMALEGNPAAARIKYKTALDIQNDKNNGDPIAAAETKIAIARSWLEDNQPAEAQKEAEEAEQILSSNGAEDRSYFALAIVAQALLAQGHKRDAMQKAAEAWARVAESEDRRLRFAVAIARAHAWAASSGRGSTDASLTFLEKLRNEAADTGFVVAELQIDLAMGEIEVAAGRATGFDRLAALEQRAKGIGSVARRAATLRLQRAKLNMPNLSERTPARGERSVDARKPRK